MKPFSPIIILTAVILALVTPMGAFGQEDDEDKVESCKPYEQELQTARDNFNRERGNYKKTDDTGYKNLESAITSARERFDACKNRRKDAKGERKQVCDEWKKKYDEIKKDFGVTLQAIARECTEAFVDDDGSASEAMLQAFTGMVPDGNPKCDLGAAKTLNKDKRGDISKDIDKLEEGIMKADKDAAKSNESFEEKLMRIEKEREDLKNEYDKSKEAAEEAQVQALRKMRDAQAAKAVQVRQLRSAAIAARQQIDNTEAKLRYAVKFAKPFGEEKSGTVNLRSEVSIFNFCKKKAVTSNGGAGLSKNGASRAQSIREDIKTCVEGLREQRENTAKASEQELEQRVDALKNLYEQIDQAEKDLASLSNQYNEDLQRQAKNLTTAQQKFFNADNAKANEYNRVLQAAQKEQSRIMMDKVNKQQKIISKYRSQGRLTEADVDQINGKASEIADLENNLTGNGDKTKACSGFGDNFKPMSGEVDAILKKREERKAQE